MTIELPDDLSATEQELKTLLAVKLYEDGKISLGQAAKLSAYSKRAFIEILGHHHIPVFNYSADELKSEIG